MVTTMGATYDGVAQWDVPFGIKEVILSEILWRLLDSKTELAIYWIDLSRKKEGNESRIYHVFLILPVYTQH